MEVVDRKQCHCLRLDHERDLVAVRTHTRYSWRASVIPAPILIPRTLRLNSNTAWIQDIEGYRSEENVVQGVLDRYVVSR